MISLLEARRLFVIVRISKAQNNVDNCSGEALTSMMRNLLLQRQGMQLLHAELFIW